MTSPDNLNPQETGASSRQDEHALQQEDGQQVEKELALTEHLRELRDRLIKSLIAVCVGFALCYAVIEPIFSFLAKPLDDILPPGTTLIFTSYPEAFFTYIKLALVCGIFVASPVILYQLWAFIAPGLYEHEKKWAMPFVIASTIFFVGGAMFGYFVVFPAAFNFLAGYANSNLALFPSMAEYFTLTIRLLLGFGIAFELPILMVFLGLVGIIDAAMLSRNRKYAILIIFTAAAIITPTPDILNQILLAGPLLLLYELSILLVWLIARKRRSVDEAEAGS